jgi:hypothetical protein
VEEGSLTADQFRAFVFDNPVRLLRQCNPEFFDGTAVGDGLVSRTGRARPG